MCAHQVRDLEFLQLVARPVQLLVAGREQVQAAQNCVHWLVEELLCRVGQYIDDAGVPGLFSERTRQLVSFLKKTNHLA